MYILRGLPGSGKSTLAKEITSNGGSIFSTDEFFLDKESGEYHFNTKSLPKAHYWNQLRTKYSLEKGISPIVIDNTNLKAWEAQPYVLLAKEYDYNVKIIEPKSQWKLDVKELANRNTHNITEEEILQMIGKMEEYNVNDAMKATLPVTYNLSVKDQNKVKHSLMESQEDDSDNDSTNNNNNNNLVPVSSSVRYIFCSNLIIYLYWNRISVTKNDGQKAMFKPVIVRSSDIEQAKKQVLMSSNIIF